MRVDTAHYLILQKCRQALAAVGVIMVYIRHPLHNLGEEIILPSVWSFSGFLFHFLENSWCREQSFKTVIEEYLVESDYFDTGMGRTLLQTAGLSVLTPFWMFLVGKYNLDRR